MDTNSITIPTEQWENVLNRLRILEATVSNLLEDDQSWYWTSEWQAAEAEADEDSRLGRVSGPMSADEALAHLRNLREEPAREAHAVPI